MAQLELVHPAPIDLDAPAMIAWNGSPQAAHALRAAVPLMRELADASVPRTRGDEPRSPGAAVGAKPRSPHTRG